MGNENLQQFDFKVRIRGTIFADNTKGATEMIKRWLVNSDFVEAVAGLKDFKIEVSGDEREVAEPIFYHSKGCKCRRCNP